MRWSLSLRPSGATVGSCPPQRGPGCLSHAYNGLDLARRMPLSSPRSLDLALFPACFLPCSLLDRILSFALCSPSPPLSVVYLPCSVRPIRSASRSSTPALPLISKQTLDLSSSIHLSPLTGLCSVVCMTSATLFPTTIRVPIVPSRSIPEGRYLSSTLGSYGQVPDPAPLTACLSCAGWLGSTHTGTCMVCMSRSSKYFSNSS